MPVSQRAEASVIDYSGRVVAKAPVALGGNIGHLPAGMYRLMVILNGEMMQQSFVK